LYIQAYGQGSNPARVEQPAGLSKPEHGDSRAQGSGRPQDARPIPPCSTNHQRRPSGSSLGYFAHNTPPFESLQYLAYRWDEPEQPSYNKRYSEDDNLEQQEGEDVGKSLACFQEVRVEKRYEVGVHQVHPEGTDS